MQKVIIEHNPFKLTTKIEVDGEEPKDDSQLKQCMEGHFQLWVDDLIGYLAEEYNDNRFDLVFRGTDLDYQDLLIAVEAASRNGINCDVSRSEVPVQGAEEKDQEIQNLIAKAQRLPYDEFKSDEVKDAIEKASNKEFDVNVVATMSAGKSTLINALLCQRLLPTKKTACTAHVTRIKDVDGVPFSAAALDSGQKVLAQYPNLDYDTMDMLNKDENISEIHVEGNIPFVDSQAVSLVLIDTPGTDNAMDERHREVTERALDKSSKMLVLFIMNGSKLNDEAQNQLLKQVSDSMKVGGKQSRERFLFVINKMDDTDEEEEDSVQETIEITERYLREIGIENPNIIPVSARLAFWIRCFQTASDPEEKIKYSEKAKPLSEKMIKQEQFHLEKYAHLSGECEGRIEKELQTAIDNNDTYGQALVHSGIRGIEETIRMYITKYYRPAKIKNVYDSFSKALESAGAFEKTKKDIENQTDHLQEIGDQMEAIRAKIESQKENEAFKEKIDSLDISSDVIREIQNLTDNIESKLTDLFSSHASEMDEGEAEFLIHDIQDFAEEAEVQFTNTVNQLLDDNIKNAGRKLVAEYVQKINALSDEFSMDFLSINWIEFVGTSLHGLESESAIEQAIETEEKIHKALKFRDTWKKRKDWDPFRYRFGDYYKVKEPYLGNVSKRREFVSLEKLQDEIVNSFQHSFYPARDQACQIAARQEELIKNDFYKAFKQVDEILCKKSNDLKDITNSIETAEAELKTSRNHLSELESLQRELEEILEI